MSLAMGIILILAVSVFFFWNRRRPEDLVGGARADAADYNEKFIAAANTEDAVRLLRVSDPSDLLCLRPLLDEAGILSFVETSEQASAFPGLLPGGGSTLSVQAKDREVAVALVRDYISDKQADSPSSSVPELLV